MKKRIAIYSLCHFIVDFVCAIYILGRLPQIANTDSDLFASIIVYNFFAFAYQVPLGYLLDRFRFYRNNSNKCSATNVYSF